MRPALLPLALMLLAAASDSAPRRYNVDPAGSSVTAKVAFFGLASKTARFPKMTGEASIAGADPATLALDVTLDATALQAPDAVTLGRLRGANFFWVDKYPSVRFTGRGMTMVTPVSGSVAGQLTARGVTRPVTLAVRFSQAPNTMARDDPMVLSGEARIDRRDFGMTAYPLIVGRKVTIRIDARIVPRG